MSCEQREADWNVKVVRAPWSSRRRDSLSRGLVWQRSPAAWNLQLYLVMSNHVLDSPTFILLLRLWDISRENCSKAKLPNGKSIKINILTWRDYLVLWSFEVRAGKEGGGCELEIRNPYAEWRSTYRRRHRHYVKQKKKTPDCAEVFWGSVVQAIKLNIW